MGVKQWRPLWRVAPVALLAISLGANALLYWQSQAYYAESNAIRLDPVGLKGQWPTRSAADLADQRPLVVFFGDSRAAMWMAPAAANWQFLNRGIGNQTSAQVVARFEAHIASIKPQVIVLQVGINDLKTLPLFPERKAMIIADCSANIRRIVQQAHALGARVIVSTIFPLGDLPLVRQLVWSADVAEAIAAVNADIRSIAQDGVQILDTSAVLAETAGTTRPEFQLDFLHLNAAGYAALNRNLAACLASSKAGLC